MDYKEWFDKLCETHEREMKQAELRGYARGYRQGLESDVVPKPCNGPKYDVTTGGSAILSRRSRKSFARWWMNTRRFAAVMPGLLTVLRMSARILSRRR